MESIIKLSLIFSVFIIRNYSVSSTLFVASISCQIIFSLRNCDSKLMIALQLFYVIPFATKCKPVRKICIFSIMKINVDTFFFLHICPTLDDIFVASKLKWTEVSVYHVITMTHYKFWCKKTGCSHWVYAIHMTKVKWAALNITFCSLLNRNI